MDEHEPVVSEWITTTIERMPNGKIMVEYRSVHTQRVLFCIHLIPSVAMEHARALIEEVTRG